MNLRAKRRYLCELVEAKNKSFPPLTAEERALGFIGWHQRGYLPHCDYPGLVQFVTFRLKDSMPAARRGEWEHLLSIEDEREKRTKLENYLDRGIGDCPLQDRRAATAVEETLLHNHSQSFELLAWCVMPNHVHVLVHVWETPLRKMLQSWKSYSAAQINKSLDRSGALWEPDYWDTFIRDDHQELTAIRYIENNPVEAKLCRAPLEWPFSSARFRDQYRRLMVPNAAERRALVLRVSTTDSP
jgi:REP element-mobilizing transposase RayT